MSEKETVLVTGANGYIAAQTVLAFLQAGYAVRGTVRSAHLVKGLVAQLREWSDKERLDIAVVPDISVPGAFDDIVRGVVAVAHIAGCVSPSNAEQISIVMNARDAAQCILNSCAKAAGPQLKAFVFMSSTTALMTENGLPQETTGMDWDEWAKKELEVRQKQDSWPATYSASKIASEKAVWDFRRSSRLSFSISCINPGFVIGPPAILPESPDRLALTARVVWDILDDNKVNPIFEGDWPYVDVRDVARLTVWAACHPSESDTNRYLAVSTYASPLEMADMLTTHRTSGVGISSHQVPRPKFTFDASKAVKATGKMWIPLDQTLNDAAKAFEAIY